MASRRGGLRNQFPKPWHDGADVKKQVAAARCVGQWRTSGADDQCADAIFLRADNVVPARGSLGKSGASDTITRVGASIMTNELFAEPGCAALGRPPIADLRVAPSVVYVWGTIIPLEDLL